MGDAHAQLSHDVAASFKGFLLLTKPGIILGNIISAAGGFFLASKGNIDITLMVHVLCGITLVIASGCVFNNVIDREIDRKMERTRMRSLACEEITPLNALFFGVVLGISGAAMLLMTTSWLCTALVVLGFIVYVLFYSLFLKRRSFYASYIGSIAGAVPPVAAYCAVTNHFDAGAGILALIFILWQVPHCHAFSIMKLEDYLNAGIPVTPVRLGVRSAKKHIILFIFAFLAASLMLTFIGATGYLYFGAVAGMGTVWLFIAWKGYRVSDNRRWIKLLFQFSLICVFVLSLMMSIDCKLSPGGGQIYSADSKLSCNAR